VNEAEISDVNDKATINHGLAICPFDASVFYYFLKVGIIN
jgi:hypothetical protein